MSKKQTHIHIDAEASLTADILKLLAERYEVRIDRRCHTPDGEALRIWLTVSEKIE